MQLNHEISNQVELIKISDCVDRGEYGILHQFDGIVKLMIIKCLSHNCLQNS